jgi:hypothetical protein
LGISAQAMRAILLASATVTGMGGLRVSILVSQVPAGTLRLAQRTTALAPMINRHRQSPFTHF